MRIARAWIGTPYHHQGSVRGAGTDCLGLIRGVWREFYGREAEIAPPYSRDWAGGRRRGDHARRRAPASGPHRCGDRGGGRRADLPPAFRGDGQARGDPRQRQDHDPRHGRRPGERGAVVPRGGGGASPAPSRSRERKADGDPCSRCRRRRGRRGRAARRRHAARRHAHRRNHRLAGRRHRRLGRRPGIARRRRQDAADRRAAAVGAAHHRFHRGRRDPARLWPRAARRPGDLGDPVRGGGGYLVERRGRRQGHRRRGAIGHVDRVPLLRQLRRGAVRGRDQRHRPPLGGRRRDRPGADQPPSLPRRRGAGGRPASSSPARVPATRPPTVAPPTWCSSAWRWRRSATACRSSPSRSIARSTRSAPASARWCSSPARASSPIPRSR